MRPLTRYDSNRTVDLSEAREYPSSSVLRSDQWFISGGADTAGVVTTEVRTNRSSNAGPEVPDGVFAPCQVTIHWHGSATTIS